MFPERRFEAFMTVAKVTGLMSTKLTNNQYCVGGDGQCWTFTDHWEFDSCVEYIMHEVEQLYGGSWEMVA